MKRDPLTNRIIGSAIEVHRVLGPGLLESAYEECFCYELQLIGIEFKRQISIPVDYKSIKLECGYRADLVVEDKLVIEVKAIEKIKAIHEAQLLTYLKLTGIKTGLLINFNVPLLKDGVRRLVN